MPGDRPRDANLDNLIKNWAHYKERLIVFLGAGASRDARGGLSGQDELPTALYLRNELWRKFMVDEAARATFDGDRELGMMTLEQTTAIIESRTQRDPLAEHVARMYRTVRPTWSHMVLPLLRPQAVFTTNYDQLVEQGWRAARDQGHVDRPLIPIYRDQRYDRSAIPLFKPHGCVDQAPNAVGEGGLVITMIDYFEIIGMRQELLREWLAHVRATCAIFIGYSFNDMDIASELYKIRNKDRGLHWYAVFPRDDDDVRHMFSAKFGILQINRRFDDFLVDLDAKVDFIPAALKYDKIPELKQHYIQ